MPRHAAGPICGPSADAPRNGKGCSRTTIQALLLDRKRSLLQRNPQASNFERHKAQLVSHEAVQTKHATRCKSHSDDAVVKRPREVLVLD